MGWHHSQVKKEQTLIVMDGTIQKRYRHVGATGRSPSSQSTEDGKKNTPGQNDC